MNVLHILFLSAYLASPTIAFVDPSWWQSRGPVVLPLTLNYQLGYSLPGAYISQQGSYTLPIYMQNETFTCMLDTYQSYLAVLDSRYCATDCLKPPCLPGQSSVQCLVRNNTDSTCSFTSDLVQTTCPSSCASYQCSACNFKPLKSDVSVGPLSVSNATVLGADYSSAYFDSWKLYASRISCRLGLFAPSASNYATVN